MTTEAEGVEWGGALAGGPLMVCDVSYPMISRALVRILASLLKDGRQCGVVVSLDRPHTYIRRLLESQGIPQERLLYIDAVAGISGEPLLRDSKAEMLPTPFCVTMLSDFAGKCGSKIKEMKAGFILVDNLSALAPYLSDGCIRKFLEELLAIGVSTHGLRCVVVLDRRCNPGMYNALVEMGAKEAVF